MYSLRTRTYVSQYARTAVSISRIIVILLIEIGKRDILGEYTCRGLYGNFIRKLCNVTLSLGTTNITIWSDEKLKNLCVAVIMAKK